VDGRKFVGHTCQRLSRGNHVFSVAAIERDAGRQQRHRARKKLASPAMIAIAAITAVPTNTDSLAVLPRLHTFADSIDNSDHLMSRHTRILDTGPESFFNQRIAVANAARLDLHAHPPSLRLGDLAFD